MSRSITLIVGTWRTGSSALAGALHAAGTHLGSQLKEHVRPRLLDHAPTGTFECTRLDALLLAALKFPEGERRIPAAGLELQIGNWLRDHCEEAEEFGRPCAGKHPALAYVLPQLAAAAFARRINVRYIDTSRPPAAIVDSLVARRFFAGDRERIEALVSRGLAMKEAYLAGVEPEKVCRVSYASLLEEPRETLARVLEFAGVGTEGLEAAVAHVRPEHSHFPVR